ncbi:peptidylprolyl isomerase [Dysgonomonas sp. BGC7]|uniref:peptidylprolyl isomerase n=2 Tax=Dysgonomonas sp. BGC7 TaxID=1658008 RepID=UPI000AFDAF37
MRNLWIILPIILLTTMCSNKPKDPIVLIKTNYGNIKVRLYNKTPIHRDNFLKKAEEGFYKDLIFHRVIKDFMIQGGDLRTKNDADSLSEEKTIGDTISAEIKFPLYYHKRGALAAARWGDSENPTKASSISQFYIVTGELIFDEELNNLEKKRFERLKQQIYNDIQSDNKEVIKTLYKEGNKEKITELRNEWQAQAIKEAESRKAETRYSESQREFYKTKGGTPFLDGEYTVFGEVIEGMDVVDKIQNVETNGRDKPIQKVVMDMVVLEK